MNNNDGLEGKFPLKREWGVWFSGPAPAASKGRRTKPIIEEPGRHGGFSCIATMWQWMNNLPPPSRIAVDGTIHLFQKGVEPFWEDPANTNGGRWMFSIPIENGNDSAADAAWESLFLGLFGETLDPGSEIVGVVLARRRNYTRFSVWTRNKLNNGVVLLIGNRVNAFVPNGCHLEYQDHGAAFGEYRHAISNSVKQVQVN